MLHDSSTPEELSVLHTEQLKDFLCASYSPSENKIHSTFLFYKAVFLFFFFLFFPHLAVVVLSKWRSALRVRGGTAGQTPAGKVKLNRAKQASRMMPFINGNIGANWRAELRGGPSGCERESQTESEGRKERRDEVEGDSARGGGGLTARPLQLLHYWSGAKWERGQSLRKKKKLKKRKEHTQRRLRTSARKQDKPGA